MTKETKVGLFVITAIALLVLFSSLMGSMNLFGKSGIKVTFYISNASGLVPNSKIKYRGLDVGKVDLIELREDTIAIISTIKPNNLVPNNVIVTLATEGLMGEVFIDLRENPNSKATGFFQDGDEYSNFLQPATMDDLIRKVSDIGEQVDIFVTALNETFATEEGKENLSATLRNLRGTTERLNEILSDNQNDIRLLVANLQEASASIKDLSAKLDGILTEEDENIRTSIANFRDISDDISKITTDAYDGKGTVGMLLSDNLTRDKLKEAIDGISNMVGKADKLVLKLEGDIEYLTDSDNYQGSFSGRLIPSESHYYYFGVGSRAFGRTSTKVTSYSYANDPTKADYIESKEETEEDSLVFSLQYALMFDRLIGARAGLLDNRIGFGFDMYPLRNDDLTLTFEASDFFREDYGMHMKGKVKWAFMEHLFLQAGWDEIGNRRNSFYIGGGIRVEDNDLKYLIGSVPIPGV
ncbi:MAG: MlaD family protein [Deferribacteraceae bacterium]|jgi:phospholipid/cholesterol/gamma-HCH transport system substrate-binding protein|nr:MlaD family protein [Deferribacteraceae bacterium]